MQCTYDLKSNKLLEYVTTYILANAHAPTLQHLRRARTEPSLCRSLFLPSQLSELFLRIWSLRNLDLRYMRFQWQQVSLIRGPKRLWSSVAYYATEWVQRQRCSYYAFRWRRTVQCTIKIWASKDFQNKWFSISNLILLNELLLDAPLESPNGQQINIIPSTP